MKSPSSAMYGQGNGQARGPAHTEIREPIAEYGVESWIA